MRKKAAIQTKDRQFNGEDFISVTHFLTDFKRPCDSSRTHEGATVWVLRKFMNSPDLDAIKAQLSLLSNGSNRHDGTITTYAEVVHHLLRLDATENIIMRADEEI